MRENRPYGSEGGGTELNRFSLPLFAFHHFVTKKFWQTRSRSLPESYNLFLEHRRNAMSSVLTIATGEFFAFFS